MEPGLLVTSVFVFVTFIWLLVVAFKENIWWGFGCLLLHPLTSLVFTILNFKKAWLPFLLNVISMGIFYASILSALPDNSIESVTRQQMELQQKLQRGEITQQQADEETRRMIETIMLGKKHTKATVDSNNSNTHVAPEVTEDTLEKARESHRKAREHWDKQWKELYKQKREHKELGYIQVKAENAKKYLNRNVRITTTSGQVREGSLLDVSIASLVVGKSSANGTFSYNIKKGTIAKMEVEDWISIPPPR